MNAFFTILLIAISLSMDAFSLALIYGTTCLDRKRELLLAVIVGIFHFFMPLLGLGVGNVLMQYFSFSFDLIVGIIFLIIGIEMIISAKKQVEVKILTGIVGLLLFGLSVSIDSFTTGIGLSVISNNYIIVALMFMIVSGIFTYIGLKFGNKFSEKFGNYATICGGILMCILGVYQFF